VLPATLGYLFDVPLALTPRAVAVIQGEKVLTYGQLDERLNRMANALHGLGLRPGDRVAVMFSNDWRFLEAFFGPMRIGAVSVPLNIRMGDEALGYVIRDAEARVLVAGRESGREQRSGRWSWSRRGATRRWLRSGFPL
jgi:long-chain acyl-CoA synthetase